MFSAELQEWIALGVVALVFVALAQRWVRRLVFPLCAARLLKQGRVRAAMWFKRHS